MFLTADLLTGDAALAAIDSVRRACRRTDGADPLDEAASLRLKHRGLDGIQAWVTADGFALRYDDSLDLVVSPDRRGAGLGQALASAALTADGPVTAWSHGDHPAARTLAGRLGATAVRELWVMRRSTAVPLPPLEVPAGVTVTGFRGDVDVDRLLAVNAAAFASHPEQGALDRAGLEERMAESWFDPAGLLMARDPDGALLGFHWTKRHDEDNGEVYVVGVSPDAQGRGLGRVLTLAGLRHLARTGVAEIHLYVEADNAPARAVYEGLGFTHSGGDTHVQYVRP
ncbi:mycothiol synthase [Nocardioides sambongensis]|uniref:mycothiol synthase n=1 Tax=Nocardioides sambongensis TaxID=2589074 RepID=UPI001E47B94C|nr:mycothiol synthase [Nocardioides sambongensis]